jgi:hypothetical protein
MAESLSGINAFLPSIQENPSSNETGFPVSTIVLPGNCRAKRDSNQTNHNAGDTGIPDADISVRVEDPRPHEAPMNMISSVDILEGILESSTFSPFSSLMKFMRNRES